MFEWGPEKYGIKISLNPDYEAVKGILNEPISLDVEDDEKGNFVGLGVYGGGDNVYHWTSLPPWLQSVSGNLKLIAHDGNTDLHKLTSWGIIIPPENLVYDTKVGAYDLNCAEKRIGLKDLVEPLGIVYPHYKDIVGTGKKRKTLEQQPEDLRVAYNCMDCVATWKLKESQKGSSTVFSALSMPLVPVLFRMEERGIRIDRTKLLDLERIFSSRRMELETELINTFGPINLDSPKQLLEALNGIGIEPMFKGKPSTDKRALSKFEHEPVVQKLLEYSRYATLMDAFITPYKEFDSDVVHPWFNQCRTRTGRLACTNPNLQQIPIRTEEGSLIRDIFIPRDGNVFLCGDFGQIEPRLLAHFSRDTALCNLFNEGVDFHSFTAERLNITRDAAKILNLSVGYRATKYSVCNQLKCSHWQAQREIDRWWKLFPRLREWQETVIHSARKNGNVLTLFGRKIPVDNLNSFELRTRDSAERQAINNMIQGSAAEVMIKALIDLDAIKAPLIASVHDEALIELPKEQAEDSKGIYTDVMETCIGLAVPLVVEMNIGNSWKEAKK